ncbi:hypothetical protein F5Y03DRAFT_96098 [Xylaria venustula]|nr:hypothetical protein F5Y03DRAFT_96098 [Xylaria venustula]
MAANNLPAGYALVEGYPSVEDYMILRSECITQKTPEQADAAMKGSWYGVYVVEEAAPTKAVAMGRVVGDGGWYFLIADMITSSEHQRKGLGDVILKKLLGAIKSRAPKGSALITLTADPPGRRLYEKNGFSDYTSGVTGMLLRVDGEGQGQ